MIWGALNKVVEKDDSTFSMVIEIGSFFEPWRADVKIAAETKDAAIRIRG